MNKRAMRRTQRRPDFRRMLSMTVIALFIMLPMDGPAATAAGSADSTVVAEQGYRIDQPGTITFTVGVKISGKVEKPQVMIFLPKEKTLYRKEVLTRSFSDELSQPLPFTPLIK
ncbi:MAG: hypothetical protein JXA18_16170 [Chitinispirillaceae bacterium]|nr:hypothetical protein [Chitinispirillaceae bacterium]